MRCSVVFADRSQGEGGREGGTGERARCLQAELELELRDRADRGKGSGHAPPSTTKEGRSQRFPLRTRVSKRQQEQAGDETLTLTVLLCPCLV